MTGPFDIDRDPDLDRDDDCRRCGRAQANTLAGGTGCWDCDAEIREMFQDHDGFGESDHASLS
jgi:hypothetical protein